jgi:cystathionine beta-lyase/cystathionine gamma-synthase
MPLAKKTKRRALATQCIHAGEERHGISASINTDIAQSSVFVLPNVKALKHANANRSSTYTYSRYANPTVHAAEQKIAALEGGGECVATSSGLAAILAGVLAVCSAGDEIVSMLDIYGGTLRMFDVILKKLGIKITLVPYAELGNLESYLTPKTKLLFLETPTNPTLRCIDLATLSKKARKHRVKTMVDSTFATPVLLRPFEFGCDIVMHSATKYLGGHSDLTAGAVITRDPKLIEGMRTVNIYTGGTLDPGAASLLIRGMKTLEVRVDRACTNAKRIAAWLVQHKKVKRVLYPGLKTNDGHAFARKQMDDFGMMLSIELRGADGRSAGSSAERFIDSLKLWYLATSLGGVESTVSYPVQASHLHCTPAQLKLLDVTPAMVRMSVGIEDADDLIADLEQALEKA